MEYFDINSITPIDSAILSLRNYLLYLYNNNDEVWKSIVDAEAFKKDLKNMKEKLQLDKQIRSIAYARQMKEFGLIADMLNIGYDELFYNYDKFPYFACLRNENNEEVYTLIFDAKYEGFLTIDKNNKNKLIKTEDFKKAYKNRIFFISDYSPLMKKYGKYNYDSYIDKGKISLDGLEMLHGPAEILKLILEVTK